MSDGQPELGGVNSAPDETSVSRRWKRINDGSHMIPLGTLVARMADDGFVLLPRVFSAEQVDSMIEGLGRANDSQSNDQAVRRRSGNAYGTRNVAALWPEAAEVWR
jgi:hypothetical protein